MLNDVGKRRGRRMVLGHRVPVSLKECRNVGCDVARWARAGYADYLSPMDFLETDLSIRAEEFVAATKGTPCRVHPSPQRWLDFTSDRSQTIHMDSLDKFRATAHNYYTWGAHGGSTFNIYNWKADRQAYYTQVIAILSDAKLATAGPRHYMYGPMCRLYTDGPRYQKLEFPAHNIGKPQRYRFRMADGRNGESMQGTLRFRLYDATPRDEFTVALNGTQIEKGKIRVEQQPDGKKVDKRFTWRPGLRVEISLSDCPPFRGDNTLDVT